MASEGSDQLKAQETIPREVQNRILEFCEDLGMPADQLLILHNVLRNFDNPQLPEEVAEELGAHSGTIDDLRDQVRGKL